jgi:hypothetical protein
VVEAAVEVEAAQAEAAVVVEVVAAPLARQERAQARQPELRQERPWYRRLRR